MNALLIAGPTASGKSALALALAERVGGTIINTDSMQVYRDLRVLTARPTEAEERRAPHRLYGHVDAAENYSAGRWATDAAAALMEARAAGRMPIFVGGTGLYFRALVQGFSTIPPVPAEVRASVRDQAEGILTAALHTRLAVQDPRTASGLRPSDRQRVLRALEVLAATGRPLAEWQETPGVPLLRSEEVKAAFLSVDRAELWARIDARFDAMLASGALEEVQRLAARDLDPSLPATKAHGVPWLIRHLRGEISLCEAAAGGKADTRHYARRQETWFRHQLKQFEWIEPERAGEYLLLSSRASARRETRDRSETD
jgi:tRNA dimethylallyltransferase